ncbi:sperm-associated antigen 4 protein-like [Zonotrichia leucophrys gambelii]|uniref:sperm-associated antigen 4 protein-like n=1 Tax=Zonotrichia leucophrys gambelii TaxID=257770 RepID=UPI00314090CD
MLQLKKSFKVFILLVSVALGVFCGTALSEWSPWTKELLEKMQSVFPSGRTAFWNSHTLIETQKLQNLLEEVTQLRAEISTLKELSQIALDPCVRTNWALKSTGATIDTQRTSQTYDCKDSLPCRILRFFWAASPPDTILQPKVFPGNCWAFKGHQGQVVIKLPARVYLTAITLQHISKDASPSGTIVSAPKDIAVFGVDTEEDTEEETLLGMFTFNVEKNPTQTFPLKNMLLPRAFSHVKLLVKSNWGNPWYTCIYRVKVHGKMENQKDLTQGQDK